MNTQNIIVSGTTLQLSGTQFTEFATASVCVMCAVSGNFIIPVKCDSTGRIGSVF